MKKIKTFIIFLSFFILVLAIYILINIFTISPEPSITTEGKTENNQNKELDKGATNHDLEELLTDTVTSKIPTLTDDEKIEIIALRSPFGTSPIVNKDFEEVEKVYQEKIKAEKIKVAKENAIKKLTESMGEKPTEQQIKEFLADGTIPQTESNQPKEEPKTGKDSTTDADANTDKNIDGKNKKESTKKYVKEPAHEIDTGK